MKFFVATAILIGTMAACALSAPLIKAKQDYGTKLDIMMERELPQKENIQISQEKEF